MLGKTVTVLYLNLYNVSLIKSFSKDFKGHQFKFIYHLHSTQDMSRLKCLWQGSDKLFAFTHTTKMEIKIGGRKKWHAPDYTIEKCSGSTT